MNSRGRHGVAYGLEGSTGFSRASARAARRRARSAAPRAAGTEGLAAVGAEGSAGALGASGVGEDEGVSEGKRSSREVNSRIWASIESLKIVGRERVIRTRRCKARRSCLRLAGRALRESSRIDLARARSSFMDVLWEGGVCGLDSVGAEAGAGSAGEEVSVSGGDESSTVELCFFLNCRVSLRSFASLGAPVAYMTRSGSTWNISPGLS